MDHDTVDSPDRRAVVAGGALALAAAGLDLVPTRSAAADPVTVPKVDPPLAAKPAVADKLAALKPNHGVLLGKADVVGEFNATARRYDLDRTGPKGRDYSIKMCWGPDRDLGVGPARVRLVGPLLAVEVDIRVTGFEAVAVGRVGGRPLRAHRAPGLETLGTGETLDEGAVDAEVLAAQVLRQRFGDDGVEEGVREAVRFQALAILGEGGGVEGVVAGLHVEEPAEEQVKVDLLAKLSFAADGIQGHQEQGLEQPLGRHAGPAGRAVGRFESGVQAVENAIGPTLDVAKRMVGTDAILNFKDVEQWELPIRLAAHVCFPVGAGKSLAR